MGEDGDGDGGIDLDGTDMALIERVETDFDVNLKELSEELDLSKSTIHYRLSRLREAGVITGLTMDVDPLALGLRMAVITNVFVTHEQGYSEDIGSALADVPGVTEVYYTMGDVDFVVFSRLQNRDQLNRLIDDIVSIPGVNETSSRFVMREIETDDGVVPNMSDPMKRRLTGDGA